MSGAGDYNQWLVIERLPNPETQSDTGTPIGTPQTHFSTYGAYEPAGSREFPQSYKRYSESTARFRIPYPDVTVDPALHRIVMMFDDDSSPANSSTWNILGAWPKDGRKFELIIEASEVR